MARYCSNRIQYARTHQDHGAVTAEWRLASEVAGLHQRTRAAAAQVVAHRADGDRLAATSCGSLQSRRSASTEAHPAADARRSLQRHDEQPDAGQHHQHRADEADADTKSREANGAAEADRVAADAGERGGRVVVEEGKS